METCTKVCAWSRRHQINVVFVVLMIFVKSYLQYDVWGCYSTCVEIGQQSCLTELTEDV